MVCNIHSLTHYTSHKNDSVCNCEIVIFTCVTWMLAGILWLSHRSWSIRGKKQHKDRKALINCSKRFILKCFQFFCWEYGENWIFQVFFFLDCFEWRTWNSWVSAIAGTANDWTIKQFYTWLHPHYHNTRLFERFQFTRWKWVENVVALWIKWELRMC